jgi:transcriptional regulator GlxA family with amidase domain
MDPRVDRVIALLQENISVPHSLSDLASSVNLSPWRFSHVFKAETGLSPMQYLKARRSKQAGYLLTTTFLSIKEIRVKVGACDDSHFVKDFKKAYGLTPTQYRTRSHTH